MVHLNVSSHTSMAIWRFTKVHSQRLMLAPELRKVWYRSTEVQVPVPAHSQVKSESPAGTCKKSNVVTA